METTINVAVTVTRSGVIYTGNDPAVVEPDGTININPGELAAIVFAPASGQTWLFQDPWVTITPTGSDVELDSGAAAQVVLRDQNPAVAARSTYTYCLQTNNGPLDPRIINKGT